MSAPPPWFVSLLEQHLDGLYRYALQLCRGRAADAEDLVQDTALRALRAHGQLRSADGGRAWLFRIVSTTHLNRARTERRRAESLASDMDERTFEEALSTWSPLTGPEEQLLATLHEDTLQQALAQLTPALRGAVWLSDVEGFSQREVAEMLLIPEGTVASRIFRARRALRGLLRMADGSPTLATRSAP